MKRNNHNSHRAPSCAACLSAGWPYVGVAAVALGLALWTRIHPIVLLVGGTIVGAVYGLLAE